MLRLGLNEGLIHYGQSVRQIERGLHCPFGCVARIFPLWEITGKPINEVVIQGI